MGCSYYFVVPELSVSLDLFAGGDYQRVTYPEETKEKKMLLGKTSRLMAPNIDSLFLKVMKLEHKDRIFRPGKDTKVHTNLKGPVV